MVGVDQEGVWKSSGSDTFYDRLASKASPPQNLGGSGVPSGFLMMMMMTMMMRMMMMMIN